MHAESDKVNWTEFENGDNISINNAKPLMHVPLLVKRLFIRPYRWRWWKSPPNIHFICFKLLLCLCNIFSFSTFFFRSSQTFSIKICSKYLYDATPNNTLWENAVYRYWFLVFMFWMYNLLFDFFKTTLCFMVII